MTCDRKKCNRKSCTAKANQQENVKGKKTKKEECCTVECRRNRRVKQKQRAEQKELFKTASTKIGNIFH